MYAKVFFYVRLEVNRPPACFSIIDYTKERDEDELIFRERVYSSMSPKWKEGNWDSIVVEFFT
jgi:hypothetical protein